METKEFQRTYWNAFKTYAKSVSFNEEFLKKKARPRNFYDLSVANTSCHICLKTHTPERRVEVGIYINNDRELFEKFEKNRNEIENELKIKLTWIAKESCKARSILAFKTGDIMGSSEEWIDYFDWYINIVPKFIEIINKYGK